MGQWQSLAGESPVLPALPRPEEPLPGLCRDLDGDGIHDQGHKLGNDIVDVQFVQL